MDFFTLTRRQRTVFSGPRHLFFMCGTARKHNIFIKKIKKCENHIFSGDFFRYPFRYHFGTDFPSFFGSQNSQFFLFFKEKRLRRNPPKCIFLYFLASALRTPKMSQKGPKNAPKMVPKQSPKGLEKLHFRRSK